VLDGAILVLCGVSGVQSQTLTVDRQMRRYEVPRISFINKLDRMGANPWKVIESIRRELRLPVAAIQIPIGAEENFEGVVDIIDRTAYRFGGHKGIEVIKCEVPADLIDMMEEKRGELVEQLSNVDGKHACL
jgi:elongation factor G